MCAACLAKPVPIEADHFCVACRTPYLNAFPLDDQGLCGLCRRGLTGFDAAYCYGSYEGELRQLIHLFKYGRIQTLARPLGRLLLIALPRERRFDVVTPMPLHWVKRWQRGFNQSELLAREVSRAWRLPLKRLVRRIRATAVQAGLTGAGRRANVAGAFRAKHAAGKRILLVDDVMTTGATASACAVALKRAGAAQVTLLTVARVDRRLVTPAARDRIAAPKSTTVRSFQNAQSGSIA